MEKNEPKNSFIDEKDFLSNYVFRKFYVLFGLSFGLYRVKAVSNLAKV
jgi:hypothetical protein